MKPVIALIEDDKIMRIIFKRHFENKYKIVEFENGKAALQSKALRKAELIITDLHMPEVDGLGVLRNLNSKGLLNKIPVFVLSADVSRDKPLKCLEMGALDFIQKPVNLRELELRVNRVVKGAVNNSL
ncbi:MAG: response regulator [Bacteroidota bacterium]